MRLKRRVFLLDLDNCLLDVDALKKNIESEFHKRFDKTSKINFWKVYESTRKSSGLVEIPETIKALAEELNLPNTRDVESLFYQTNFKRYLYPETPRTIKSLKRLGDVKVFSLGNKLYQSLKIRKSGIERAIGAKNVIIVQDKKRGLKKIISSLLKNYKDITIVDDRSDVLESVSLINPKVVTVWIKHGEYENILPGRKDSVTYKVNSLSEALLYLETFVETIPQRKLSCQISIIREIYGHNIDQLIIYTKTDRLINRFTHDKERFKNKKSFNTWKKRNKTIYTLIDNNQKLLGIIWFAKEKFRKYKHTFAIRIYPPARGKGLSYQFMKACFDDFNKHGFWLTTANSNKAAIAIYKKFGFKQKELKNKNILMTLE